MGGGGVGRRGADLSHDGCGIMYVYRRCTRDGRWVVGARMVRG